MNELEDFRLSYPLDDPLVVQPFGVNWTGVSDFYTRFGLPAHEGIDFRARTGTNVYACADGVITRIERDAAKGGAYGVQVRIEHTAKDGVFETVYAHLQAPASGLSVGDRVARGQLIGTADNTGNSRGDHLHLTLKKRGATARKEKQRLAGGQLAVYPSDVVDPSPYFRP